MIFLIKPRLYNKHQEMKYTDVVKMLNILGGNGSNKKVLCDRKSKHCVKCIVEVNFSTRV